jgi:multidrug efflux pump subunit AcrB
VRSIAAEEKIEDVADTKSRPLAKTKIVLDPERMRERGVSRSAVENVLRGIFAEQTIGTLRTDESVLEPENIVVSLPKAERSESYFKSVTVPSSTGTAVPMNEIASFQTDWMRRETYTENRSTTIHLYAEMGSNSVVYPVLRMYGVFEDPAFVAKGYEKIGSDPYGIRFLSKEDGKEYRVEWGGEWELTMDTFRDMGTAMILSLLAIYFLVVAEFKSFRIGGIIMMTFLFSFFGIFPGFGLLYLWNGTYFTATAMIGAIALGGIVVGNAIILLDYVVQLRASGKSLEESVITGSKKRFVPVLLTSIAAVLGSLIIASDPVWSGLAWSIVF